MTNIAVEENKALMRRFYEEVLNKGNVNAADEFIARDVVNHSPLPGELPGLEGTKQGFAMMLKSFPDIHITVEDILAEGDKVVTRSTWRGTHKGQFMGIPPTNKPVTVAIITIDRISSGKIVEHWDVADQMAMMQQLGVVSLPT